MPDSPEDRIRGHPDEVLLQMTARKSVEAYEALYDRHAQVMYNLVLRIVHRGDVADEILQDAFWQIWQKAGQYRGSGAAAAWMYRVARNRALDHLRREHARPQAVDAAWEEVASVAGHQPSAEAEAETKLRRELVVDALNSIPSEQRDCLEMAYFEGKSQREIAELTETALGTIKSRMRIGLEKLARVLRSAGVRESGTRQSSAGAETTAPQDAEGEHFAPDGTGVDSPTADNPALDNTALDSTATDNIGSDNTEADNTEPDVSEPEKNEPQSTDSRREDPKDISAAN